MGNYHLNEQLPLLMQSELVIFCVPVSGEIPGGSNSSLHWSLFAQYIPVTDAQLAHNRIKVSEKN